MIISVASGKGGTGKTLVATSLAIAVMDEEHVQLLDCDVEEPNAHILLNPVITSRKAVCIPVPEVDTRKCNFCRKCAEVCTYHAIAVFQRKVLIFPELCHGCGACISLCPITAISEKLKEIGIIESGNAMGLEFAHGKLNVGEAMPTPVIRMVKAKANLDGIVIIDVPPGTSCPVVESLKGSDFCILVTEPTSFGLNDLTLAVETVRELNIPCGIVLNRASLGDVMIEEYCRKENLSVLLKIPLDIEIARFYSRGLTLVEGMPQWKESFRRMFRQVKEITGERNCYIKR